MLVVVFRERSDQRLSSDEFGKLAYIDPHDVIEVWANGEELRQVHKQLAYIPASLWRDVDQTNWYGDMAKFIVANLRKP